MIRIINFSSLLCIVLVGGNFVCQETAGVAYQGAIEANESINIGLILSPQDDRINTKERQAQLINSIQSRLDKINELSSFESNLQLTITTLVSNPIEMSRIICNDLIGNKQRGGVSVVIIDTNNQDYLDSIATISFTLGLYNIPIIGTTIRDSSLFNKNIHSSYISLIPPYSHQADVWFKLIDKFKFKRAFVLTSSENQDLLSRFVELVDKKTTSNSNTQQEDGHGLVSGFSSEDDFRIEAIVEYNSGSYPSSDVAWQHLSEKILSLLADSICRVFLIHAQSKEDTSLFINIIFNLNMTSEGFALIFSEETMQIALAHKLPIPAGVISSQLNSSTLYSVSEEASIAYVLDTLTVVVGSLKDILQYQTDKSYFKAPNSCQSNPSSVWQFGLDLYSSILHQTLAGLTGIISFDENGDRYTANYNLLNFVDSGASRETQPRQIGTIENLGDLEANRRKRNLVNIDLSLLEWPGGVRGRLISGLYVNQHLSVVTLLEKPFVWILENNRNCWPSNSKSRIHFDNQTQEYLIGCRRSDTEDKFCCKGYCMDLLVELSIRLNFTFDLYFLPDNQYGTFELSSDSTSENKSASTSIVVKPPNLLVEQDSTLPGDRPAHQVPASSQQASSMQGMKWSGLIGELVSKRADMAFAPLTITPSRAQVVDFSKPFKFHGFSILLRRASKHTTLASFLQPFHNQLWILVIGVATHVVALTLYLLDRYSTFGAFGMKHNFVPNMRRGSDDEGAIAGDHPLHLSSSLWFSWSILLNSGVGEHTPKSLSGRVLGIFWSGFAMIVVASYTANLAAFLVLDSREETPTLSGIDDPRLRSGELAFNFATVKGSAVDAYLQSQVEYINLYRKMEEFNYNNVDELISALRSGTIDALIWDSTRLEWEAANDEKCSLGIAGELFGSGGYGIGLQKDSFWTRNVTTKLLELHESGFMIELDKRWIGSKQQSQHPDERAGSAAKHQFCASKTEDSHPETLGIFNIAGVFILFACGLLTSFGLICVEQLCFKHKAKLTELRRRCFNWLCRCL